MKSFVYIALLAFLGSIPIQAYGPKRHHNNHGRTHRPPSRSTNGFENSPYDSPTHGPWPHGHGHNNRPPQDFFNFSPYVYFELTQPWDDSTEWDSDSDSWESNEYSSENFGIMDDWHNFHHSKRPCKRHCKWPTKNPSNKPSKTTPTERPRQTKATVPHQTVIPLSTTPNSTPRTTSIVSSTEAFGKTTSPQPITEEEFPTLSPEIINCIESCISTPEFNPVCGTDGETYENEGKLYCAKSCGVDVSLRRRSVCPPPIFDGDDEGPPPTPPPTTTTSPVALARTPFVFSLQLCMKQCAITPFIRPVCGSNFVTYINVDRLECARGCGEDVEVLCEKPCPVCGITSPTAKPKTTPTTPTLEDPSFAKITLKPARKECFAECPTTLEYNPVCGTDQITYRNPSHLLCAQLCGVGVSIDRFSACNPTATHPPTTTTSELPTTTISLTQIACFTRCPVTSEYNPVCGTDDLTYTNPGFLECAKFCGIKVELKSNVPCELEFENDNTDRTTLRTTKSMNEYMDEMATVSRRTATTTSLFTSPIQTTTPVTILTTTPVPISISTTAQTSSSTRFFIPPNILKNIFGPTPTPPKPSTINPDDDEDIDIDDRFSNDTRNNSDNSRIIFPE